MLTSDESERPPASSTLGIWDDLHSCGLWLSRMTLSTLLSFKLFNIMDPCQSCRLSLGGSSGQIRKTGHSLVTKGQFFPLTSFCIWTEGNSLVKCRVGIKANSFLPKMKSIKMRPFLSTAKRSFYWKS